jgi:hypothetical protein
MFLKISIVGRKCDHIQGVVLNERLPWDTETKVQLSLELQPNCSEFGYNTRKHGDLGADELGEAVVRE